MEKLLNIKVNSCWDCPNLKNHPTHTGHDFECPWIDKKISLPYTKSTSYEIKVATKILKNWFNNLCTLPNVLEE